MKNPLHYQMTEYDCGPTAILNAISFLFPREEINPDILRYCYTYTLDCYNSKGEHGKKGTSKMAMTFLASWLTQYGKAKNLPIECETLDGADVRIDKYSRIAEALLRGGVAVVRVNYGGGHYVTLTGIENDSVLMFDPYYRKRPFTQKGIKIIEGKPCEYNRVVDFSVFSGDKHQYYSFDVADQREAVLIFNNKTCKPRKTAESTIEYYL
jgi:hypothetical protein